MIGERTDEIDFVPAGCESHSLPVLQAAKNRYDFLSNLNSRRFNALTSLPKEEPSFVALTTGMFKCSNKNYFIVL